MIQAAAQSAWRDLRCVACGGETLHQSEAQSALVCSDCERSFPILEGMPFVGAYETADIASLIQLRSPGSTSSYAPVSYLPGQFIEGVNLFGWDVLIVGPFNPSDPLAEALRGARVTALEFIPDLPGCTAPHAASLRRIGGLSSCLPFQNAQFDAVICDLTTYRTRDIHASLTEALRVLRPAGVLLGSHASFSTQPDTITLDPNVLLGLKRIAPPSSEWTTVFERHRGILDVELHPKPALNPGVSQGNLSFRVRLKAHWTTEAALLKIAGTISPGYATASSSHLANLIPAQQVDLPFPGTAASPFELAQGWLPPENQNTGRKSFRRGRWFLRRPHDATTLAIEIHNPHCDLLILQSALNGVAVQSHSLAAHETITCAFDLENIPAGDVVEFSIQTTTNVTSGESHDFEVRSRRWLRLASPTANEAATVFAVIPVFNRLHFTLDCIACLKEQTHPRIVIIVADGGSSDGTVETIKTVHRDIHVLTTSIELWWAGSMHRGIEHALGLSTSDQDCLLMVNNDTRLPPDYVATLLRVSHRENAAVGALIVDSRDPAHSLDAGEYMNWPGYDFPLRSTPDAGRRFIDDVDFLPGRGTLVPVWMIRKNGNVDARRFPHYLADYDFFYRLKKAGCKLCVCYETKLEAHIEETGIVPTSGKKSFRSLYHECFSRRSMNNVRDHARFIARHAPPALRAKLLRRVITRVPHDLLLRGPLRPLLWPGFSWTRRHLRAWVRFSKTLVQQGRDTFCVPKKSPYLLRPFSYALFGAAPFTQGTLANHGLNTDDLLQSKIIRRLPVSGWYSFDTFAFNNHADAACLKKLWWAQWNPLEKLRQARRLRADTRIRESGDVTLGIELIDDPNWMGGTLYTRNLAHALSRLPEPLRPKIRLLGTPAAIAKTLPGFHGPRASSSDAIDAVYPGLGAPILGAVTLRWVPDFQHRHCPALFSTTEIELRDRTIGELAAAPGFIVFSSATAAHDFTRFYPEARATPRVWHFRSAFNQLPPPRDPRQQYSLPEKYLYLPNQFWAHKNHRVVFEALAHLKKTNDLIIPLVCTGSPNDPRNPDHYSSLLRLLAENQLGDQVHLLGLIERADQIEVFRHAAAVVQPSLFEGWSTVVEDTRSIGRPLILSDIPVHREQAPSDSVLFDPLDPLKLAAELIRRWAQLKPGPCLKTEQAAADHYTRLVDASARVFCDITLAAIHQRKAKQ